MPFQIITRRSLSTGRSARRPRRSPRRPGGFGSFAPTPSAHSPVNETGVVAALQPFGAGGVPLDHSEPGDCANEASNGRPDELLGVDLLPALPAHQDGMSDRGHRTRLRLCSGIIPKADGVQMRGSHGSDRASPELEPLQRHKGVGLRHGAVSCDRPESVCTTSALAILLLHLDTEYALVICRTTIAASSPTPSSSEDFRLRKK
jgi:hypothetical protein